jgi:hypothetical protein
MDRRERSSRFLSRLDRSPDVWSSLLNVAMYAAKVALFIYCSALLSLLLALLKRRLSSGVWVRGT